MTAAAASYFRQYDEVLAQLRRLGCEEQGGHSSANCSGASALGVNLTLSNDQARTLGHSELYDLILYLRKNSGGR